MKTGRRRFLLLSGAVLAADLPGPRPAAQSRGKPKPKPKAPSPPPPPPLPEGVLARLEIAKAEGGVLPAGVSSVAGRWTTNAAAKTLEAAPEPILDAWLEFGPEIREQGASIVASGRAPSPGRLQSRLGVGLYGKNGFQLRLDPARQRVELVRRGAVLRRASLSIDPERLHHLELSVRGERGGWLVGGRVWTEEGQAPEQTLLDFRIASDELQFPLAGRSVLLATPFSGEPVAFLSATVYREGYRSDPEGGGGAVVPPEVSEREGEGSEGVDRE
jgi:hypothetical protein